MKWCRCRCKCRCMKWSPLLLKTSKSFFLIWCLLTDPGFNSILPDKINIIFKYKRLYLFFILLIVNSLTCISAENSLILQVTCKTSCRHQFHSLLRFHRRIHTRCWVIWGNLQQWSLQTKQRMRFLTIS